MWARALGHAPIRSADFVATHGLAALAVGVKTSAVLALALPLALYWRGAGRRTPRDLAAVAGVWLLFCWQYLANMVVLGSVTDPGLSWIGLALSPVGGLVVNAWIVRAPDGFFVARFFPALLVIVAGLAAVLALSVARGAGRRLVAVQVSGLLLVLLCPFLLAGALPYAPQLRLILPAILLLGMAGAATVLRA